MPRGTGGFLNPDKIIEEFDIKKGESVADFGCGAGYFAISMARVVGDQGQVYALDIVQSALESVRSRAQIESLLNIETIQANLEVLGGSKLDDQSLDVVLLANILFQSSQKKDIIKETKRVLKNEGRIIIIDWKENQLMGPPQEFIVSEKSIQELLKKEGFKFKKAFSAGANHWGVIFNK